MFSMLLKIKFEDRGELKYEATRLKEGSPVQKSIGEMLDQACDFLDSLERFEAPTTVEHQRKD